ncbi:MAG: indole-3-glycerol phosphate synthase TrpC [Kofleriaceae bacterium]
MSVLDRILRAKAVEVAAAKQRRSLAALEANIQRGESLRGLSRALSRPAGTPVRVLAEVKRASPSAGAIRPGADPAEVAAEYAEAGASAISVLTDREFFDGRLEFLAQCRARVSVPLLRKDFIIDSYQLAEARAAGADAVLLIVAALSPDQLAELLAAATSYGLDALVEVHDRHEAEVALAAGTTLLGINHRNLKTLEIDMSLTPAIAPEVPAGVVLVAESGIRTADDITQLGAAGAHAVLVGEHLMRAASPGAALRALREGP